MHPTTKVYPPLFTLSVSLSVPHLVASQVSLRVQRGVCAIILLTLNALPRPYRPRLPRMCDVLV